jgi:hypothetical protein
MTLDTRAQRAWMEQWRRAAVALAEQRKRELRALSEADALAASDALLSLATLTRARRPRLTTSGLVQQQATPFTIQDGVTLTTCSAEDLIVFKAFAGREKDWLDIEGIALRQQGRLDEGRIWAGLTPLLELKGAPDAAERLRRIFADAQD